MRELSPSDRIFDVMSQLDLFTEVGGQGTRVLILNFGEKETDYALKIADRLTGLHISSELYPDAVKLKKQMIMAITVVKLKK